MAVKRPVRMGKNGRKSSGYQRALSRSAAVPEVMPAEIGASPERTAAFDPLLLLTKLATEKTNREYRDKEAIFSQGDAADAVFYIQSAR